MNDFLNQILDPLKKGEKIDWQSFLGQIGNKVVGQPQAADSAAGSTDAGAKTDWAGKARDFINSFFK